MLQWIIIAAVVLFATGYVTWTFLPLPQRQRLLDLLAAHGYLAAAAARHRARLATPGCGRCSGAISQVHPPTSSRR